MEVEFTYMQKLMEKMKKVQNRANSSKDRYFHISLTSMEIDIIIQLIDEAT